MRITKFAHSCLLVEEGKTKILIDPGRYCFIEGKMQPEDFPDFNVLLFTHEHPDHLDVENLPKIIGKRSVEIFTNASVAKILLHHSFKSQILAPSKEILVKGVSIQATSAPHGIASKPEETPENIGFLISKRFLHPGDSLKPDLKTVEILALPITAPWLTQREFVLSVKEVSPKIVVPIHDAMIKEWFRVPYERLQKTSEESNFKVAELKFRESFEI